MILHKRQLEKFEEVTRPLIEWLEENCHPHTFVIVEPDHAELVEGVCSIIGGKPQPGVGLK